VAAVPSGPSLSPLRIIKKEGHLLLNKNVITMINDNDDDDEEEEETDVLGHGMS
jgi:hypothetical protein